MAEVRQATEADVETVVDTVVSAFAQEPAWLFMIGPGNAGVMRAFARTLLIPRLGRGTVWVADDGAAVAMWDRRAQGADDADDEWWARFRQDAGEDVWNRLSQYEDALHADEPGRPYWYLGVLATRPDAQGKGLATAVIQPALAAAGQDGWDCWLETSTPENKAFYQRRGFTQSIPVEIPGGPPTWWLRRPPATTAGPAG